MNLVTFEKISATAQIPTRATEGSAGFDLYADEIAHLAGHAYALIRTGIRVRMPKGLEGQIRPRSGLATRGVTVLNAPGTIDSDYRGELKVLLINHGHFDQKIEVGQRIAQLVFVPLADVVATEGVISDATGRGSGGFGSTGK